LVQRELDDTHDGERDQGQSRRVACFWSSLNHS
jgi:hypothetical protein